MNSSFFLGMPKDALKPSFKLPEDAMRESGLTLL